MCIYTITTNGTMCETVSLFGITNDGKNINIITVLNLVCKTRTPCVTHTPTKMSLENKKAAATIEVIDFFVQSQLKLVSSWSRYEQ